MEPTVTEREANRREQCAAVTMAHTLRIWLGNNGFTAAHEALFDTRRFDWNAEAEKMFPLPRVTRPREVKDPHSDGLRYRYIGGYYIEVNGLVGTEGWVTLEGSNQVAVSVERARAWADLLANPTETVPDGE